MPISNSHQENSLSEGQGDSRVVLQRALREIRALRAERDSLRQGLQEPLAIVGMGLRLPEFSNSPETFWNLLRNGNRATSGAPERGTDYSRGGFLRDIDKFDPVFFGISPQEAPLIDPQHRLLLEVCWDALENSSMPPSEYRDAPVGLFVGISLDDYAQFILRSGEDSRIDGPAALGSARSMGPGRVAYALGFSGPVMQLDTSCSSSLLAVHLACQSLRNRECEIALAGGVNLILSPETGIALERMGALAADGLCKTFDASADGYARGEGCGIVVLKPLRAAQKDGDRILAVIVGSAVNHDGRSNGLTAPNGMAQEALIATALRAANLKADDIQYVETHGTGTSLGDPIELEALARALGTDRTGDLYLGSVKTNLGHLESAAGIAGLIKTVLMLGHAEIPAIPNLRNPNPRFPWDRYPFRAPRTTVPWPAVTTRRAGVSAFGMSGTNVHVIVQAAPALPERISARPERSAFLLCLSARSASALNQLKLRHADNLRNGMDDVDLADYTYSARTGRTEWPYRIAVTGDSAKALADALIKDASVPRECFRSPRIAFHFREGDGSSLALRELLETEPEFRGVFEPPPEVDSDKPADIVIEITPGGSMISALGEAWAAGAPIRWDAFDAGYERRRVSLPPYPYEKQRYWADYRQSTTTITSPTPAPIHKFTWTVSHPDQAGSIAGWQLIPNKSGLATELARLLPLDAAPSPGITGTIFLAGFDADTGTIPETAENLSIQLLRLVQSLTVDSAAARCTLYIVTCGAHAIAPQESANPATAALIGFGHTIAAEHPELNLQLIDLDPSADLEANAQMLFRSLTSDPKPGQPVAWRNGTALARTVTLDAVSAEPKPFEARPDRTYLITGGYGGVGLEIGLWLARRGARNLALIGRNATTLQALNGIAKLRDQGLNVLAVSADVGTLDQTTIAIARIRESMPPLGGVIHAAGVYADRLIRSHEPALFTQVFSPKVHGAWHLHTLTLGDPLDFFILCSSAASMLGAAGLANYSAANAFLDALAHYRAALNLPALSVNWGPWDGIGMSAAVGERRAAQLRAQGISPIKAPEAFAALEILLTSGTVQAGIFHLADRKTPHLLRAQLLDLPATGRRRAMIAHVRDTVAERLGYHPASSLPVREGFFQIGMDSLAALEVSKALRASLSIELPTTAIFAYPDVEALAGHLLDLLFPETPPPVSSSQPVPVHLEQNPEASLLREIEELEALLASTGS
jgi:acyl transferase domain-containing protein/acyl carrier protein